MRVNVKKLFFRFCLLGVLIVILWQLSAFSDEFSLHTIQMRAAELKQFVHSHYVPTVLIFMGIFIFVNLWFPAAAVLTLLAGFLYSTMWGSVYVLAATTLGAVLAFSLSRHLAGEWVKQWVMRHWQEQLQGFDREIHRRGSIYLVLVRLIPMMPFAAVNFVAGLTAVRLRTFAWTTAAGSLPGILILTFAGRQLLTLRSMDEVFTGDVLIAFGLLAFFVLSVTVIQTIVFNSMEA